MPMRGRYQVQLTPAEYATIMTALEFFHANSKAAKLSEIEEMVLTDTVSHLERAKLYE